MPKVLRRRSYKSIKVARRRRQTRKLYRKQNGGTLSNELTERSAIIDQFVDSMARQGHYIAVHPNFPRKNTEGNYIIIFKDTEMDDNTLPQRLLVIKMRKQDAGFVGVNVEYLMEGIPQTFIDEYPLQLSAENDDTFSLGAALSSVSLALG